MLGSQGQNEQINQSVRVSPGGQGQAAKGPSAGPGTSVQ
jgi:hypothetical protein